MVKLKKKNKSDFRSSISIFMDGVIVDTISEDARETEIELNSAKAKLSLRAGNGSAFWDRKSNEIEVEDGDEVQIEKNLFFYILTIVLLPIVFGAKFLVKYISRSYPEYAEIAKFSHIGLIILFFIMVALIFRFAKLILIKKVEK